MTDSNLLIEQLSTIRHRRFIARSLEELAKWFFLGTVGAIIFTFTNRFWQIGQYLSLFSLFLGVCVGIVKAVRNREDLLKVAQFIDHKFDLKERVSTAFEVAESRQLVFNPIEQLQIEDAKEAISSIDVYSGFPYKIPKFAKFIPISLTLIAVLFWQTGQSASQTKFEREAMQQTAKELERLVKPSDSQIHEVIDKLRNDRSDVEAVQTELAKLHASVRKRNIALQSDLTEKLERLAKQEDLPPELRDKLAELLKNKEIREQEAISDELRKTIEKMIEQANEIARLDEISRAIQFGQQKIGLANLAQLHTLADRDGEPGDESGTNEAIGTEIDSNNGAGEQGSKKAGEQGSKEAELPTNQQSTINRDNQQLIETASDQNKLLLNGMESDSENFSMVYAPDLSAETGKSFSQYREVYLASQQEVAEAISNGRVPTRYVEQVKDYFKAIAPK